MIKAVIFDLDGVLVDAKDWHFTALNRALAHFGMEISRAEHLMSFDGLPTSKKLELLSRDRGLPMALHEFINELKQQYTIEEIYKQCRPVFSIEYAVSHLKGDNLKLAVCSNSIRKSVEVMLERSMILEYFDTFLSNQDVSEAKPAPEMYIKCMAHLAVTPEETLIIEDNPVGIEAAEASGAHVLRVERVSDVTYQAISEQIREIG